MNDYPKNSNNGNMTKNKDAILSVLSGHREASTIADGIKDWLNCLPIEIKEPTEESVYSYHFHDYIEFLYAFSSGAHVWINGERYQFNKGDLIVINSEELHTVTYEEKVSHICVHFLPHILYFDDQMRYEIKYAIPFLSNDSHQKLFRSGELKNTDVHALVTEIFEEFNAKKPGYELIIRANIQKLFCSILRYWHENNATNTDVLMNDTLKKALAYIAKNYNTITEKEVAKECGLSYNHFSNTFKKFMGRNFSEYLIALKLKEAEKLLISTNYSITEVAQMTGFSTTSHFISRFKQYKNITPKQFKSNIWHKKDNH